MTDPLPPECYLLESEKPLPNDDVLPLWNDDHPSDQHWAHLMSGGDGNRTKAAGRWASPDVVARFSGIPSATAKIEKRGHSTDYWVIRGRPAAA